MTECCQMLADHDSTNGTASKQGIDQLHKRFQTAVLSFNAVILKSFLSLGIGSYFIKLHVCLCHPY